MVLSALALGGAGVGNLAFRLSNVGVQTVQVSRLTLGEPTEIHQHTAPSLEEMLAKLNDATRRNIHAVEVLALPAGDEAEVQDGVVEVELAEEDEPD